MGFQVSPGVVVTEKDLTTIVPSVSTTDGALVGFFRWGPLNDVKLIGDENQLVKEFGKPNDETASSFFTAANFLAYGNKLRLVRVAGADALNASTGSAGILIKNDDDYLSKDMVASVGEIVARHPGELGNSLKISICPSAKAFKKTLTGTISSSGVELVGVGTMFTKELAVGSVIKDLDTKQERVIVEITDDTHAEIDMALNVELDDATLTAKWEHADLIGIEPGSSSDDDHKDEMHIVVVDADGKFSGVKNTILEKHTFVSKASDAKNQEGSSIYYVNVINRTSSYIRFANHPTLISSNWGNELDSGVFGPSDSESSAPITKKLANGADDNAENDGARILGYDLFANAELIDVSLILLAEASQAVAVHVINNICETRKDCVAFISPPRDAVVNNPGNEVDDIITFRESLPSSSYAVMDSGHKYQYDKYNDIFRYVPLNGDVAGLCARTDQSDDPWFSPAGYNRGNIKNVIKLSFNPFKAERDDLYLKGINPVISTQGLGTILFGDKTLLAKPSAFDRINVRRLFIVLEKAIAKASKFMLFEFNDEFTRQQFRSLVEPFLRNVQSRRGIYDFKVVCDRTNNTTEVIDRNEFVGDIYIKPARSINFIQLNFVAVRSGVDFSEIVGKV
jgi:hypothetical protein